MTHSNTPPDRKDLTDYALHLTAYNCCQRRGVTTSLEVKNALREQGYEAFQADVSSLLQALTRTTAGMSTVVNLPSGERRCIYFIAEAPMRIPMYESASKGTVMIASMNPFWMKAAIVKILRKWAADLQELNLWEIQDQVVCSGICAEIAPDNLELQDLCAAFGTMDFNK